MKLICNVFISSSDKEVIIKHLEKAYDDFVVDIDNMKDELKKDHLRCFGWMLKNGKLEIKGESKEEKSEENPLWRRNGEPHPALSCKERVHKKTPR